MWTREELKTRAKAVFYRNYWKCVLVALILGLVGNASSGGSSNGRNDNSNSSYKNNPIGWYQEIRDLSNGEWKDVVEDETDLFYTEGSTWKRTIEEIKGNAEEYLPLYWLFGFGAVLAILAVVAGIFISVFIFNVFEVGGCNFFVKNTTEPATVREVLSGFESGHYLSTVTTMFFRTLYTILWSLLLIIPGVIKAYEYKMIPYLLAEFPRMSRQEAFEKSREMMDGNKWDAFVLDLSFIGWKILGALTFGILDLFFVNPYVHATGAELYLKLKSLKNIGQEETVLNGEVYREV